MFDFVNLITDGLALTDNILLFVRVLVLYMILRFMVELIRALMGGVYR